MAKEKNVKELPKIDTTENETEDRKPITFYCRSGEYSFTLPEYERDEFGEIIKFKGKPKKLVLYDADGNKSGEGHKDYKFKRVPVKDPKSGKTDALVFLGRLIVEPDDERYDDIIAYLTNAKKNAYAGILTEDEYKQGHNPDAFAYEKQLEMYTGENKALKEHNDKMRAALVAAGFDPDNLTKVE